MGTVNFMEVVARKKVGEVQEWEVFKWEAVGEGEHLSYIIEGGVPRLLKSGKRKGKKTWRDSPSKRTVVTKAEIVQAAKDYEAETGNCHVCCGSGQEWAGWSCDEGNKYRDCRRCSATGKAPSTN